MNNSRTFADPPRNRLFGVSQVVRTVRAETILFDGFGNNLWRTDDAGATYRHIPTTGNLTLSDFVPHPLDAGVVMARATDASGVDTLFLTDNAGNGWRPVQSYIYYDRFAWGHEGTAQTPSIWILEWPQKSGRPSLASQFDVQLVSSHDEFQSPGKVELKHTIDFLVDWRERLMLAAVLRNNGSTALQLYASPDLGKTFYAAAVSGRPHRAVLHVPRPPRRRARVCARAQPPRRRLWHRVRLGRHRPAVLRVDSAGVGRERPGRVPAAARHAGHPVRQPEARAEQRL
jgi:hypothetical protein